VDDEPGERGLKEVARVAVLNNNYLLKKVKEIRGSVFLMRKDSIGSSRSGTAGKP